MKTFRIVACGMAVAAMTWLGARTAHAEESYWYGEVNAAGSYVPDPATQSSFTNSAF